MGDLDTIRQALRGYGKAMILAGDEYPASPQVAYRVIGAVVAEFHFLCFAAQGEAEQLMPKTEAKGGDASFDDCAHGVLCLGQGGGIARAITEKDAVRAEAQDFGAAALWGEYGDAAAAIGEQAQNIAFGTKIHHNDMVLRLPLFLAKVIMLRTGTAARPLVPFAISNFSNEIGPFQAWKDTGCRQYLINVQRVANGKGAVLCPVFA